MAKGGAAFDLLPYSPIPPYRYSVPLLITSAVLHWLVSWSIFFFFFVAIVPFNIRGKVEANYRAFSCGYSLIAIIFAISLGWSDHSHNPVSGNEAF